MEANNGLILPAALSGYLISQALNSSNVAYYGVNVNEAKFFLQFKNGSMYLYDLTANCHGSLPMTSAQDIQQLYDGMVSAVSPGKYANTFIVGRYHHERMNGDSIVPRPPKFQPIDNNTVPGIKYTMVVDHDGFPALWVNCEERVKDDVRMLFEQLNPSYKLKADGYSNDDFIQNRWTLVFNSLTSV